MAKFPFFIRNHFFTVRLSFSPLFFVTWRYRKAWSDVHVPIWRRKICGDKRNRYRYGLLNRANLAVQIVGAISRFGCIACWYRSMLSLEAVFRRVNSFTRTRASTLLKPSPIEHTSHKPRCSPGKILFALRTSHRSIL